MQNFNLNKEIHSWLRKFRRFRPFDYSSIREMELHLRDHIEDLISEGQSPEQAFRTATRSFGDPGSVAREENWNVRRKRNINSIINNTMFSSYVKVAIRHFRKHKFHSFLNLAGLTTGLSIVFFIFLFVNDELSYDQHIPKKDVVYRVVENQFYTGQPVFPVAVTPTALAPSLTEQFPSVVSSTRASYELLGFEVEGETISEEGLMVEASFFDIFSVNVLQGDVSGFATDIHALVLTETLAEKYFPEADPIGKLIRIDGEEFQVRAVVEDPPGSTHLPYNYLVNFEYYLSFDPSRNENWGSNWLYTYVELDANASLAEVNDQIINLIKDNSEGSATEIYLQPVTGIYLGDVDFVVEAPNKGEMLYVNIFTLVAFFILIISCINFMNLATAKSENRAKEVGLRKTVGAIRGQLIIQFLSESVLMSIIAVILAAGLVYTFLPFFNSLAGKSILIEQFLDAENGLRLGLIILGSALFTGLAAGIYPALVLSSPLPALTLKNNGQPVRSGGSFRKILVIVQFTISIILIIGTLVVVQQLNYIQDVDLGYNKRNLAYLRANPEKAPLLAEELRKDAGIVAVGLTNMHPGYVMSSSSGYDWQGKNPDENVLFHRLGVDENYLPAMEMRLVEGRNFRQGDTTSAIINQRAAEILGFEEPLGSIIKAGELDITIIGVVADFNFKSIHTDIEPLLIYLDDSPSRVFIRYQPGEESQVKETIQNTWTSIFPDEEFSLSYLDEDWEDMYTTESRTATLSTYFAAIAIIVSCLGLFGLVSYTAEQRTREIGIRKVLGASVPGLFMMLAKDFTKLIVASMFIAIPVGWYLMNRWLNNYAYHIDISFITVLVTVLGIILITLATISYQSIKISRVNPVKVLKNE